MLEDLITYIKGLIAVSPGGRREACRHEGESGTYCGRCGADLRVVASYECRVCELLAGASIYTAEKCPNFCTSCGAPKFTFRPIRKKRALR